MLVKVCDVCGSMYDNPATASIVIDKAFTDEGKLVDVDFRIDFCPECDKHLGDFLSKLMKEHGREPVEPKEEEDGGDASGPEAVVHDGE